MKKLILGAVIIIIVLLIISNNRPAQDEGVLKVGAVLSMTGVNSLWGEQVLLGMKQAIADLNLENKIELVVEDSQGTPTGGISAFNKLTTVNDVDVVLSMFSSVSIPLIEVAESNKVPLFLTIVSTNNVIKESHKYAFRMFHVAEQTGGVHFDYFKNNGIKKIGLVYLNDEYGLSTKNRVAERAHQEGIEVVEESYLVTDTDFRTQLTKVNAQQPDIIMFITIPPLTLKNFIVQAKEMGIETPIVDVGGIIPGVGSLALMGEDAEGMLTSVTPFDLAGSMHNTDNNLTFGYAYGYDFIQLLLESAIEKGDYSAEAIVGAVESLSDFEGLNGEYTLDYHEFRPDLRAAVVRGDQFEELK